jgi:hypothetical protein
MVTDLAMPEVRSAHRCPGDLGGEIAAMADRHGILVTRPSAIVVVAGDYGAIIRTLRGDRRTALLADLQIGRALRSAGIDWATWAARDLASGQVERELRAIAEGIPPAGRVAR